MDFVGTRKYVIELLTKELSQKYLYHDVSHTFDVHEAARRNGKLAELNETDQILLETAALFHDTGLIHTYDGHETKSAEIAAQVLPQFGYSGHQVELVAGMIMATRIPQSPQNFLEQLICDADLDYLGRDDFFILAFKLQLEWKQMKIMNLSFDEWLVFEKDFLVNHKYFTTIVQDLRNIGKEENLVQLESFFKERD